MRHPKIYSTNIAGEGWLVRAYSMRDAARGLDVPLGMFRQYTSLTNKPPETEVDYDFTEEEHRTRCSGGSS